AALISGGKNGLEMSATISPMLWVRPVVRARAARLGRYPRLSAAASTRLRVAGLTRWGAEKVRETVETCTPEACATSRIVAATEPPHLQLGCPILQPVVVPVNDLLPRSDPTSGHPNHFCRLYCLPSH